MASFSGSATSASSFIAGYRIAVHVLLAPKLHLLFLGAFDASLAHFLVVLDLCLRKLSVLPENDVEAQTEYAKRHEDDRCDYYFHQLMKLELISS